MSNLYQQAEDIFYKINYVKFLNAKLIFVSENQAEAEFTVLPEHGNYLSALHGGVLAGISDTIAFFPGRLLPSGLKLTTSSLDIKFLKPSNFGDTLIAVASIIHFGKKRVNVEVKIFSNDMSKIISISNLDLMIL